MGGRGLADRALTRPSVAVLSELRRRDLEDARQRVERRDEPLDAGLAVDLERHGDGGPAFTSLNTTNALPGTGPERAWVVSDAAAAGG